MSRKPLGEILVELERITQEQLEKALDYQKQTHCKLGEALMKLKFVTTEDIYMALTKQFGYPYINLGECDIAQNVVAILSAKEVYEYRIIPFGYEEENNTLHLAMAPPFDLSIIEHFNQLFDKKIKLALTSPQQITMALQKYYS